jgi:uroporphyrinogen decarboxylase
VPLIGFSGSPWTLACYMVEGGSDDYRKVKALLYSRPDLMHHILDVTAKAVTAYLNAQIEAGAQAVMIFDSGAACWPTRPTRNSPSPTSARSSPA